MKPRVLVVDDEETIRRLLKSRLDRDGCDTVVACQADEAEKAFEGAAIGVLVTDLKMPGKDGFQLMKWAREKNPLLRVIVITGHGEKEVAVRALREGASDYLEKPFDMDELGHAVGRCLREYQLERENQDLVGRLEARVERVEGRAEDAFWFVSQSHAMARVNEWLKVLQRESMRGGDAEEPTVMILGESGTGKEGVARMVHAGSRRGRGPWVALNCANFSEQLLESELFGHEKGAFTGAVALKRGLFEIARGGTLFLDEVGEMDIKLQARLLRVLQERVCRRVGGTVDFEVDVRVIAATNADLKARVAAGKFREDLYHRLNCVIIEVPPLRERADDAIAMARQFAERAFRSRGKTFQGFASEAEAAIRDYQWPGNVRELLNVIERASLVHEGSAPVVLKGLQIPAAGAPQLEVVRSPFVSSFTTADGPDSYMNLKKRWTEAFEREYLQTTLDRHSGNVSAAAREARLDRSNFLRLLRKYGLRAVEFRKAA